MHRSADLSSSTQLNSGTVMPHHMPHHIYVDAAYMMIHRLLMCENNAMALDVIKSVNGPLDSQLSTIAIPTG